ncbi:MAG: cupin domain-containing protein [Pikeienuella sp.]
MKPISTDDRRVANLSTGAFAPFIDGEGAEDGEVLQVNPGNRTGYGFHIYRMKPGQTTTAHEHVGDEEFFLIEGEIIDHDGYRYGPGDLVWLRSGTEHHSYSPNGATLVVYLPGNTSI